MPIARIMLPLADLAEEQWGLITRRQAQAAGVSQATLTRLVSADILDRVAHGVYRLAGSSPADHLGLRAAWLQLDPETPGWERRPEQGIVSHRSAAALYGIGHLPADRHEFTLPVRRQTRRQDVRLHIGTISDGLWIRPARPTGDPPIPHRCRPARRARGPGGRRAHRHRRHPGGLYDYPGTFVGTLAPHAHTLAWSRAPRRC